MRFTGLQSPCRKINGIFRRTKYDRPLGQAAEIVTTEEVLTEFLAAVSRAGIGYRRKAVLMVRAILTDENILVLSQSHESFMAGLDLYERRADKGYSLTDCISMNTCRSEVITDILTNDHHFTQEGFNVLISR